MREPSSPTRERGPAEAWPCATCGAPARGWVLMLPAPRVPEPEDFEPRCAQHGA